MLVERLWRELGLTEAARVLGNLAKLSKNPFLWHSVVQALSHSSTWPGTAMGFRLLIGAVFLDEDPTSISCDSACEFCGPESTWQNVLKSLFTVLYYPRPGGDKRHDSGPSFTKRFTEFLLSVLVSRDSVYAEQTADAIADWRLAVLKTKQCPISVAPSLTTMFRNSTYFYAQLRAHFPITESSGDSTPLASKHRRTVVPSVGSFLAFLAAKAYEASTVESGRRFDSIMMKAVAGFASSLPLSETGPSPSHRSIQLGPGVENQPAVAAALVQVIKNSLVTVFLPPTAWTIPGQLSAGQLHSALKAERLERCNQFMEPSAVLSVVRHMMSQPGVIPDLSGSNEGKFNYSISGIKIVKFDLDRCVCVLKSLKTSSPTASPVTTASVTPEEPRAAKLSLIVKEVNIQLEHEWRIDWNSKRYGSYFGRNVVNVRGLSSKVDLTVFPDDQGPVVDAATISLGTVEHSCSILNASFISEMLAQAALDWFAEPLTRLLQTASEAAVEQFIKSASLDFRIQVWNRVVLPLVPQEMLAALLVSLNDHLPKQGIPI